MRDMASCIVAPKLLPLRRCANLPQFAMPRTLMQKVDFPGSSYETATAIAELTPSAKCRAAHASGTGNGLCARLRTDALGRRQSAAGTQTWAIPRRSQRSPCGLDGRPGPCQPTDEWGTHPSACAAESAAIAAAGNRRLSAGTRCRSSHATSSRSSHRHRCAACGPVQAAAAHPSRSAAHRPGSSRWRSRRRRSPVKGSCDRTSP